MLFSLGTRQGTITLEKVPGDSILLFRKSANKNIKEDNLNEEVIECRDEEY